MLKKITVGILITYLAVISIYTSWIYGVLKTPINIPLTIKKPVMASITPTPPVPTVSPMPEPTQTPKPLSFQEMNNIYGPCAKVFVLMYHHIQTEKEAAKKKETSLTTYVDYFEKQLQSLKEKNYSVISPKELIDFFDGKNTIPAKAAILTFDDGYSDFYTFAFPLLKQYGFKGTVFVPTGLVDNTRYLTWIQIEEMKSSGLIYFANHTWSHKAVIKNTDDSLKEIQTADIQLKDRGLNQDLVFAYPYGSHDVTSENILRQLNYKLAFTTSYGVYQCTKSSLSLPRVRAGNKTPQQLGL